MRNRTYGGVRGRKTKVGRKLLRFPPTRLYYIFTETDLHSLHYILDIEQEVHDVAVLDDVFLALCSKLSGGPYGSL